MSIVTVDLARPGRPRHRPRRRQGGVRRRRAARRDGSRSRSLKRKPSYELARAARDQVGQRLRVMPRCPHFGVCGGCSLQHAEPPLQVAAKQRVLEEALVAHRPRDVRQSLLPAVHGPAWGYRYAGAPVGPPRAEEGRRAGRFPRAQVELRRRHARMPRAAAARVRALAAAARTRGRRSRSATGCRRSRSPSAHAPMLPRELVALVLRVLDAAGAGRRGAAARVRGQCTTSRSGCRPAARGQRRAVRSAGRSRAYVRYPSSASRCRSRPTEFTQVNPHINRVLVRRAMALLDAAPGRARRGLLLRPRQLHAADRAARRRRRRHRGQRRRWSPAPARTRRATASRERTRFVVANLFAATPESLAPLLPLDQGADRPAARGRRRAREGAAAARDDAGGRSASSTCRCNPGDARARRRRARPRARLRAGGGRRRQHVPAHRARRVDRAVRR